MAGFETTIIEFDIEKQSFQKLSVDSFEIDYVDPGKIYWIHSDLNQKNTFKKITKALSLPDTVVNLCQQTDGMPKLIDTDDTLTMQLQCLFSTELNEQSEVDYSNLIIHLTKKFCFTASLDDIPVLSEFEASCQKSIRYAKTPCFILFLMLDNAINDFARAIFNFEVAADEIELHMDMQNQNSYNDVMHIKQQLMKVKRYAIAIREMLVRISGKNIAVISEQCRASLSNLSNHNHMIIHEIDSIRDMLNGLLDQIDNAVMQRMSQTMKVLTAFAAIFLPLTLITGIYGMNFHFMPELTWRYGYFWALGLLLLIGIGLFYIFKKMKWF